MNIEFKISRKSVNYAKAIAFLEKRVSKVIKGGKELIWLLEHPTTFTAGIRSNNNEIMDKSINIIKTNRGGKITLHNEGQKVIYFVINLNKRKKDIRNLVTQIENIIIEFLRIYKINSYSDKKNIGIWVKKKKIAAIGIKVKKWVAYHGFSINIKNDLSEYLKIKPCGLSNTEVTSIFNEKKKTFSINKNLKKVIFKNIQKI